MALPADEARVAAAIQELGEQLATFEQSPGKLLRRPEMALRAA